MRNDTLTVPENRISEWNIIDIDGYPEATHGVWNNPAVGATVERMKVLKRFDNEHYVLGLFKKPIPGTFMAGPSRAITLNATLLSDAIAEAVRMGAR